jgi:hypothetical protein
MCAANEGAFKVQYKGITLFKLDALKSGSHSDTQLKKADMVVIIWNK